MRKQNLEPKFCSHISPSGQAGTWCVCVGVGGDAQGLLPLDGREGRRRGVGAGREQCWLPAKSLSGGLRKGEGRVLGGERGREGEGGSSSISTQVCLPTPQPGS